MIDRSKTRKRLTDIEAAAEILNAVEQEPDLHDLAAGRLRLQVAMRAYAETGRETSTRREYPSFVQTALGRVLAAELAVYLGQHAADAILGKIHYEQPGSQEVLTAIEPSLRGFLGRDAAAAVATKIIRLLEPGHNTPLPQNG
jgi:hypothetical protein